MIDLNYEGYGYAEADGMHTTVEMKASGFPESKTYDPETPEHEAFFSQDIAPDTDLLVPTCFG